MTPSHPFFSALQRTITRVFCLFVLLDNAWAQPSGPLPIPSSSNEERGLPLIQNYHFRSYEHLTSWLGNWAIVRTADGSMAVGNGGGVLLYNGTGWQLVETPAKGIVRGLGVDAAGRTYVGSGNELGYLAPDAAGKWRFVSLLAHLPPAERKFGEIFKVLPTGLGVFFQSDSHLLCWDGKKFRVWKPRSTFSFSGTVNGMLYVQEAGKGLFRMQQNYSFEQISQDAVFTTKKLTLLLPLTTGDLLAGTRNDGLFRLRGGTAVPLPGPADDFAKANSLWQGLALPGGTLALASPRGGVLLVDQQANIRQQITQESGLVSNNTYALALDGQGGLWITANIGMSRIDIASAFSLYTEHNGYRGTIRDIERSQGRLYVGTALGLYRLEPGGVPGQFASLRPVSQFQGTVWNMYSNGQALLVSTTEKMYQLRDNRLTAVTDSAYNICMNILPSPLDPNVVFCTGNGRLFFLRWTDGGWRFAGLYPNFKEDIISSVTTPSGDLWLASRSQQIYRLRFPSGRIAFAPNGTVVPPQPESYGEAHGIPAGLHRLYTVGESVVLRIDDEPVRLLRFDTAANRFVEDPGFGERYGVRGASVLPGLIQNPADSLWLWTQPAGEKNWHWTRAIKGPDGQYQAHRYDMSRIATYTNAVVYPDGDQFWFGNLEGIARFERVQYRETRVPFRTSLAKLTINGDSVIYPAQVGQAIALPFGRNELRFEFGTTSYTAEGENRFQYTLQGYDEKWSAWTKETYKEYTGLTEGTYTFRVRSRNLYGQLGAEAAYSFSIEPPWYRTWPMYGIYALLGAALLYLLLRLRVAQVEREKQFLEKLVAQRTQEVARQAEQLARQTEKLKELDGVKSAFFANISHEFRTPLTLILGNLHDKLTASEGLAATDLLAFGRKEVKAMHRNAGRLLELINQLLDLSKLESGKMQLEARPGDLGGFLRVLAGSFASLAASKRIQFALQVPEEALYYCFDADKLEKIFTNLLSNAFKFTPDGGIVTLRTEIGSRKDKAHHWIKVFVQDSGVGIAGERLSSVFERFYQGSKHFSDQQGTGIGLALVKDLVELHGGRVYAESNAAQGTCFVAELPLKPCTGEENGLASDPPGAVMRSATAPRAPVTDARAGSASADEKTTDGPVPGENASSASPAELPLLLLVEDNEDLRSYIRTHLQDSYRVLESENGKRGLEVALQQTPDLIITDLMMPELDGMELCARLKTDERTSHIPVVMLTALATQESKLKGLENGADEYLTKPFDAKELRLRVANLVESRRKLQEKFSKQLRLAPKDIAVSSVDEKLLERILAIVEENLGNAEFGPEAFAREAGMSRMQLHRKLTALTGQATGDFIRTMRLKRAAQLLEAKAGNVSEIAYQVGFETPQYFSRCFKEHFGMTAGEYLARQVPVN